MFERLFADNVAFGPRSWLAVVIWLIALGVGFYLYSIWQERNPVRMRFLRQFGLVLAIMGGVGLVVSLLRAVSIPFLDWPIWGYLVMLATLGYAGWGAWYYFQRLPALAAVPGRQGGRSGPSVAGRPAARAGSGGARTYSAPPNTAQSPELRGQPRPVATTGRREARRDKKRKSR